MIRFISFFALIALIFSCSSSKTDIQQSQPLEKPLRVVSFNIEDVHTADVLHSGNPRLQKVARILQQLRPDVVLIKEIAYDQTGAPGFPEGSEEGLNGQRFADNYLAKSQGEGLAPLLYSSYMAPSNTGIASGFDLDRNGTVTTTYPIPAAASEDGKPPRQTPEGRAYGGDSWGFGTFPGQYAMALLVRNDFKILANEVRTFQSLAWSSMPDALLPTVPDSDSLWYSADAGRQFRLSSKTHMDIPVNINGKIVHFLCSHPTPPAFDGPEARNKKRNHDEIRLWADYLNNEAYVVDDSGTKGGLPVDAEFIILGDLNADPEKGSSINNPIGNFLLNHPRVQGDFIPKQKNDDGTAGSAKTATWGLRVDYVLPSTGLKILDGGVYNYESDRDKLVSDHYPVWLDLKL
ncbi:MAG: endonuclease/exonuclease/phosphatase family protein [Calditrichota bacterium]